MRDSCRRAAYRILGHQAGTGPFAVVRRRLLRDWSIGIYSGPSPLRLAPSAELMNPVITAATVNDVSAAFVADPFLVRRENQLFMFFEIMNAQTGRGEVGLATSYDGVAWSYVGMVLRERFHLSYPQVFLAGNDYWLIPESRAAQEIRLYRAYRFPGEWKLEATLVSGEFVDPTVLYRDNLWWLFATSPDNCLSLFFSPHLTAGWRGHSQNPVIASNSEATRMAGRILETEGRLIRLSQDAARTVVRAFNIAELQPDCFSESEAVESPILQSRLHPWSHSGVHHMDALELRPGFWIASVDGIP